MVKSRRGLFGGERGKGFCYQWKEKGQCSKGDQCSFRHESDDRVPKPTPKPAPPSEPSMTRGRSASRKRSVRGRSQTDRILRQPCRCFLKGTYWHPPQCQFCKTESGCKAGDKCLFPHYKVEEQPSKSRKRAFKMERSDDKGAVAVVKTVLQLGCVSQDSEPSELPESVKYRRNPSRKVLGSIRRVRFTQSTLRQAGIREPSLGKRRQNSSSAKSLRYEI